MSLLPAQQAQGAPQGALRAWRSLVLMVAPSRDDINGFQALNLGMRARRCGKAAVMGSSAQSKAYLRLIYLFEVFTTWLSRGKLLWRSAFSFPL